MLMFHTPRWDWLTAGQNSILVSVPGKAIPWVFTRDEQYIPGIRDVFGVAP